MPTPRPADGFSERSTGGRPPASPWATPVSSPCSVSTPDSIRSETMLETVERESPVARAISARLARPRSRNASMTRPRFSSLSDRSDPESDDSTAPDTYRLIDVCQDYGVTPSQNVNDCQESEQSSTTHNY